MELKNNTCAGKGEFSASFRDGRLTFGNSKITRTLDLSGGYPVTISLRDGEGAEYAAPGKKESDFGFIGMLSGPYSLHRQDRVEVRFAGKTMTVKLFISKAEQHTEFLREYTVYAGVAAVSVCCSIRSEVMPDLLWGRRGDLDQNIPWSWQKKDQIESCVDGLLPAAGIKPVMSVEFLGRTDFTEELVKEHRIAGTKFAGNLLYCRNRKSRGFLFLQEAPPSAERRDFERYDFRVDSAGTVFSCGWGVHPAEFRPKKWFRSYRHTVMLFGDAGEEAMVLKQYQALRFASNEKAPVTVTVNPWGGGRFTEKISEEFLEKELVAAARIGATHYQVDDGYQAGDTLRVSLENRFFDHSFWRFSERFPNALNSLKQKADSLGVELSLWFLPGRSREFRDWRESVEVILGFYRDYGVRRFKFDGILTRTYEAEENLRKMLEELRRRSHGEIFVDMDVTNGQRPGYWMQREYSNIFLENRYCFSGWGYHPEKILRTFWQLSRYLRAQYLQIEIPSPSDVDPELYRKSGQSDPRTYPAAYWAAVALFGNPLFWMTPSTVPDAILSEFREMSELFHRHCREIRKGEIFPVGAEPDGRSITGFYSWRKSGNKGCLILFREALSTNADAEIQLPFPAASRWETVAGNGEIVSAESKTMVFRLPRPCSFALFRFG